jgi:HEAT repeat protein
MTEEVVMADDETLLERLHLIAQQGLWDWPDWGYDAVIAGLKSEDNELQELALESAMEAMDEEIGNMVLKMLQGDGREQVRAQAALALGPALEECTMDDDPDPELVEPIFTRALYQRIQRVLRSLYYDPGVPKLVRRRALEASAHAPLPWHQGAVRSAHLSGDDEWQLTAVTCMGFIPGFDNQLIEALETGSPALRYEAVCAVENARLADAGPYIRTIACDENAEQELRIAAVRAIPNLSIDNASALLQRLAGSKDKVISEAASLAISELTAWEDINQ